MDSVKKRGEVISLEQRSLVAQRYKRITRAVNIEFWNSTSEVAHSLYVGSYGRGTAINTSDIDILIELPKEEYNRYDSLKGNGQSRLLQALKNAILQTYPKSNIRGDGQVVVIDFSDGMKFEDAEESVDHSGKYGYPEMDYQITYEKDIEISIPDDLPVQ